MIRYYPSHVNLRNRFSQICGQHVGIMESQILFAAETKSFPNPMLCTNMMPAYHKLLLCEHTEVNYHLSGYGYYREESLIRLLGEGIERYSLFVAPTLLENKIVYASYNEICKEGEVVPWEYIRIYSDEDYDKLESKTGVRRVTPDDTLGWLKCPSIFQEEREIFVPAQQFFTGYQAKHERGEKLFTFGFSKGSAAHTDFKQALMGAITESIEIDALMIFWYAKLKSKKVVNDDLTLMKIISDQLGEYNCEIIAYLCNPSSLPANSFAVTLINKKQEHPYVVMGCQASLDPVKGYYRAFMEALAILYLANYGSLILPADYLETTNQIDHTNLDSNVAFWAFARETEEKKRLLCDMVEGEIALSSLKNQSKDNSDDELRLLLGGLKEISEYGVYLDITPPEVAEKNWRVVRTFFPELVQMSLPGFPCSDHPRIKSFGGIKNEYPHPLP